MTPREKIEKAMKESVAETIYASGWGVTPRATDMLECAYTKGAEYGYNLAIEQTVNWLCMNMIDTLYLGALTKITMSKPELINNLKQAMKL